MFESYRFRIQVWDGAPNVHTMLWEVDSAAMVLFGFSGFVRVHIEGIAVWDHNSDSHLQEQQKVSSVAP